MSNSSSPSSSKRRRSIPGMAPIEEGREFRYVEIPSGESFSRLIDSMLRSCPEVPLPRSGGVIEEKAQIKLDDKALLLALSYRGDLAGWRQKIEAFCRQTGRRWGEPRVDM